MSPICPNCKETFKDELPWNQKYYDHYGSFCSTDDKEKSFDNNKNDNYNLFLQIIGLDGKSDGTINIEKNDAEKKIECMCKAFEDKGRTDISEYLKSCSIDEAFNNLHTN